MNTFQRESKDKLSSLGIGKINTIHKWLNEYKIGYYSINEDLSIDVDGSVCLAHMDIYEIPEYIQFNLVKGFFNINSNHLTSLRGCPYRVTQWFSCEINQLNNLDYAPKSIGHDFYCHRNEKLTREMCLTYKNSIFLGGKLRGDKLYPTMPEY
jgi:hypothetical protein